MLHSVYPFTEDIPFFPLLVANLKRYQDHELRKQHPTELESMYWVRIISSQQPRLHNKHHSSNLAYIVDQHTMKGLNHSAHVFLNIDRSTLSPTSQVEIQTNQTLITTSLNQKKRQSSASKSDRNQGEKKYKRVKGNQDQMQADLIRSEYGEPREDAEPMTQQDPVEGGESAAEGRNGMESIGESIRRSIDQRIL